MTWSCTKGPFAPTSLDPEIMIGIREEPSLQIIHNILREVQKISSLLSRYSTREFAEWVVYKSPGLLSAFLVSQTPSMHASGSGVPSDTFVMSKLPI